MLTPCRVSILGQEWCAKTHKPMGQSMNQDDDYEVWVEDDFFSALYVALDKLEELDPAIRMEPWFKFLEKTVDNELSRHIVAVEPIKH